MVGSEVYSPFPAVTEMSEEKGAVPEQVRLSGPKSRKVMLPVGPEGPAPAPRMAVSVIGVLAGTDCDEGRVERVTDFFPTTTCSLVSLQADATPVLLASPL